jgi:acetyl esterase/lipase
MDVRRFENKSNILISNNHFNAGRNQQDYSICLNKKSVYAVSSYFYFVTAKTVFYKRFYNFNMYKLITKIYLAFISVVILIAINSCAFKCVTRSKNISYLPADSSKNKAAEKLNVFAPHRKDTLKNVLVFVYGGSWNSGKRSLYNFFGSRWARKNVVTVILDYPKSPGANYDEMATDVAKGVKWVKENIERYGGNPAKIFIAGHSAGGHLATLLTVRNDYFEKQGIANPIKGNILIDAAGLDMYSYLKQENLPADNTFIQTFTNDPENWKAASPMYHLHKGMPPMLIYVGEKTYPSIRAGNDELLKQLKSLDYDTPYYILKGKKHKPMITQFFNTANPRYKEMTEFMKKEK